MWLGGGCMETGTRRSSSSTSPTSTTRSTTESAAGLASAQLSPPTRRAWYVEDTDRLGLGRPDVEPTAVETIPDQIADDRGADRARVSPTSRERRRLLPRRAVSRTTDGSAGSELDQVEEQEPNPRKEDRARLRALEGAASRARTRRGSRRGGPDGPGGTSSARRCRRSTSGHEFEIHGGGLDLVFPHHENEIAQSRALDHPFAQRLDAQRDARLRRRGDAQVGRQRRLAARRARPLGPRERCSSSS